MEDLFREILTSPLPAARTLPHDPPAAVALAGERWEGEAEMQRLLDMLPDVRPAGDAEDGLAALEMGCWEMEDGVLSQSASAVGVF